MRIAVTGATSFIGRHLLEGLSRENHNCVAIVRPGGRSGLNGFDSVDIVEADMADYKHLSGTIGKVDCLINLAWLGTRGADRMNTELQKNSYLYTLDAIRSFADAGCSCVVTAGSQAEYGSLPGYIKETDTPNPNTEYGKYKLKLFEDAFTFCENNNIRLIEPRFFSLYGPGDYNGTLIIDILRKMLNNEDCDLTEGVQMWDYLYIKDAVDALILLLDEKAEAGIYNFASGDVRKLRDYVVEMKAITGSSSALNFGKIPYPETGMVSIMADTGKLRNTGWRAKTAFRDGVTEVINCFENN